jgi:hypothetical protein
LFAIKHAIDLENAIACLFHTLQPPSVLAPHLPALLRVSSAVYVFWFWRFWFY